MISGFFASVVSPEMLVRIVERGADLRVRLLL